MSTSLILLSDFRKTEIEPWRPIAGRLGFEVSNLGRVRTFWRNRFQRGKVGSAGAHLGTSPRILRQHDKGKDHRYSCISLRGDNGKYRFHYTHRFVALAFLPNPEGKPEVNHITALRSDCRARNLEWATRKENVEHAQVNGLILGPQGSRSTLSKLDESDIVEIRRRLACKEPRPAIALLYSVHERTVRDIERGKTWKHVA